MGCCCFLLSQLLLLVFPSVGTAAVGGGSGEDLCSSACVRKLVCSWGPNSPPDTHLCTEQKALKERKGGEGEHAFLS